MVQSHYLHSWAASFRKHGPHLDIAGTTSGRGLDVLVNLPDEGRYEDPACLTRQKVLATSQRDLVKKTRERTP